MASKFPLNRASGIIMHSITFLAGGGAERNRRTTNQTNIELR
jgi:hypothetical protein